MRNRRERTVINKLATVILTMVLLFSFVPFINFAASADAGISPLSLFSSADNVSILVDKKAKETDLKTGVQLTTSQNNAVVAVKDKLAGAFSIELKIFNEQQKADVSRMVLLVTDKTGNAVFDFVIEGASADSANVYLAKSGFAISDTIAVKSSFFGNTHDSIVLSFNQKDESVAVNGEKFDHSLRGLIDLDQYSVSLRFVGVVGTANIIIYELMGQSLQYSTMVNSAAPSIYISSMLYNGKVGNPVELPHFVVFDVLDKNTLTTAIKLLKPNGDLETIANDSYSFTPTIAGEYTALYTATDSGGLAKSESVKFTVFETIESQIILEKKISDTSSITLGKGTKFIFPAAHIDSDYARLGTMAAKLTIEGSVFDATRPTELIFNELGTYSAVYSLKENISVADVSLAIEIKVEDIPAFAYSDINSTYSRSAEFAVPAATASYGNENKAAEHKLYLPDGSVSTASSLKLEYIGEYRLEYSVVYNGTSYSMNQFFNVVTDVNSWITNTKNLSYSTNTKSPSYAENYNGIKLTALKDGASFTYSPPIDFTGKTSADALLEFLIIPETQGKSDLTNLTLRFTDVANPDNYITLLLKAGNYAGYYYLSNAWAGAGKNTLYGDSWGAILPSTNERGAQPDNISFQAVTADNSKIKSSTIQMDYESRTLYAGWVSILDLDKPAHVGGSGKEWNGFLTGKATLSITFGGTGSLLLLGVDGQKLSGSKFTDNTVTKITVDNNGATPLAQVGEPYKIFSAYAESAFNSRFFDYDVKVFSDYGLEGESLVDIVNDAFVPPTSGQYTIVYSVGSAVKTVDVEARDSLDAIGLTTDDSFFDGGIYAGEFVTLPEVTATGGAGRYTVTVKAEISGQTLDIHNLTFTPLKEGEYKITYTVVDYIGNVVKLVKNVNSGSRGLPFFTDSVNINNGVMLSGTIYTIPELGAYEFVSGELRTIVTDIGIKDAVGDIAWLAFDRKFTPDVTNHGDKIKIVYRAKSLANSTLFADKEFEIAVLKPANVGGYFYGKNTSINASDNGVMFNSTAGTQINFVNTLPAFYFYIDFTLPSSNAVSGITYTLTDSENPNESISFGLVKNGDKAELYINGKYYRTEVWDYSGKWTFKFNHMDNSLENAFGTVYAPIRTAINGDTFTGFSSNKVFMTVTLNNAGKVELSELCGQGLNNSESDWTDPLVYISSLEKSAGINQSFYIPKVTVVDILDPMASAKLTLTAPDKTIILSNVSADQDYNIVMSQYGNYSLRITVTDKNGNQAVRTQTITVRNEVAPQLTLTGDISQTGVVGAALQIYSATASDFVGNTLSVDIYVIGPSGGIVSLSSGTTSFIPNVAGTYRITYYTQDSNLNFDSKTFEIKVGVTANDSEGSQGGVPNQKDIIEVPNEPNDKGSLGLILGLSIGGGVLIAGGVAAFFVIRARRIKK